MANFTVTTGTTDTTAKSVGTNDIGTIQAGGTLSAATAITWTGGSATPGVTIDNAGTISASTRGIDTSGSFTTGSLTFDNESGAKLIASGNDGFRVNTNITTGTVTIDNAGLLVSGAVDASGHVIAHASGQAVDLGAITSATANVSITNEAGGVIGSSGDDALRPGSGNVTIVNHGLIDATASANRAINLNDGTTANLTSFHLTNGADGTIQSQGDTVRITATTLSTTATSVVTVDNAGLIQSTGVGANNGQAIDFNDLSSTAESVTITNEATGIIRAADADAVRGGTNAVIDNAGLIQSLNGTPTSTGNDAIDFQADVGGTVNNLAGGIIDGAHHGITGSNPVTVNNAGTITGHAGSGINLDTLGLSVTTINNSGTIIGTAVNNGDKSGDAIDVDALVQIENHGLIQAVGASDIGTNEGVTVGAGTIDNYADGRIVSTQNGIDVDDGSDAAGNSIDAVAATTVYNEGLIEGDAGVGIRITDTFADTITNKGTIVGSISTDRGDDVFNLYTGSSVSGVIDGGDGTDTINLQGSGSGSLGSVVNVETVNLDGGNWTLGSDGFQAVNFVGSNLTLTLANATIADGSFAGTITGFAQGDAIDLAGVGTATSATLGAGNVLTVAGGSNGPVTLQLDPSQSFAGERFNVVADGNGGTSVTLTANHAPVAANDSNGVTFQTLPGFPNLIFPSTVKADAAHGVLANDSDADHDALHVTGVSVGSTTDAIAAGGSTKIAGTYGTLTLASDGSYSYAAGTKPSHVSGQPQDVFTYTVDDGHGGTTQATLTLNLLQFGQTYSAGTAGQALHGSIGAQVLDGSAGHENVTAGIGLDTLIGGNGDTLSGGLGTALFVFDHGFGQNKVQGFVALLDQIQFSHADFATAQDVLAHTASDGHGNTLITLDANDVVTLVGTDPHSLKAGDIVIA